MRYMVLCLLLITVACDNVRTAGQKDSPLPDVLITSDIDDMVPDTDAPSDYEEPELTLPDDYMQPEILSFTVTPNPFSTLSAIVTLITNVPTNAAVEFGPTPGYGITTNTSSEKTEHRFEVVGMKAETLYHIRAFAVDTAQNRIETQDAEFITGKLPEGVPGIKTTKQKPELIQSGYTFFGLGEFVLSNTKRPLYFAVDTDGAIVWYYLDDASRDIREHDVTQLPDGNLLIAVNGGFRVITPGGTQLLEVNSMASNLFTIHHDVSLLPNGNYLTLIREQRTVTVPFKDKPIETIGDIIVELDQFGKIQWSWNTFDHIDNTYYPSPLSQTALSTGVYDWTHANAVQYIPEENAYLLSLRHLNWILKISRETGEIIWRLGPDGDFTLENSGLWNADIWFYAQHDPKQMPDGTLLLYDNGNDREGSIAGISYSRAMRMQLDTMAMKAQIIWEFSSDLYTAWFGGAQELPNSNILVCAGGVVGNIVGAVYPARLYEVTSQNPSQRVWELEIDKYTIYRTKRITTFYPEK